MATTYTVTAPSTPGATPSVTGTAHTLRDARRIARATSSDRRDLRYCDVRIDRLDGQLVEYAGPCR